MIKPRIHFISIGGSIMSNLAISLKRNDYQISGSDDEIYDPAKSKLETEGLLPNSFGWSPDSITEAIDMVILGMHAKSDNPELLKAQKLKIPIYSFPDYILRHSKNKQRIVIGGSHGKTTITALVVHTLMFHKKKFDYVIGALIKGVDCTVKLSDAPIIIIEGDEYPCSSLESTPKFIKYNHHIGLINGIAWDHANIFSSKEAYENLFHLFAKNTPKAGLLLYNEESQVAKTIGEKEYGEATSIPYQTHRYVKRDDKMFATSKAWGEIPTQLFGRHNFQNIAAALTLLKQIGITEENFYRSLPSFTGAEGRLEQVFKNNSTIVYNDFAHAPSKVKASTEAIKERYPDKTLVGCLELHTFSSLHKNFLPEYRGTMENCNQAIVYYDPMVAKQKNLAPPTEHDIQRAFEDTDMKVFTDTSLMEDYLTSINWASKVLLIMSSGHFNGINLSRIIKNSSLAD